MKIITSLLITTALGLATRADAGVLWTKTGAACVPDWQSLSTYSTPSGTFTIKPTSTGFITGYCAVNRPISPTSLTLRYTDSIFTGPGASNKVTATYYKRSKSTGTTTALATVDSNTSGVCFLGTNQSCTQTFTDTADFDSYYYFVEIDVARTSTSNSETAIGVELGN